MTPQRKLEMPSSTSQRGRKRERESAIEHRPEILLLTISFLAGLSVGGAGSLQPRCESLACSFTLSK